MVDWFGKKKRKPEISPGGSVIRRYDPASWFPGRTGTADQSAAAFADARHAAYEKLFGQVDCIFEETSPLIPRVDLRAYYRRGPAGANVCTLVTSGMSDLEMSAPGDTDVTRRVDLILYCSDPKPEYFETMRWLAHFPHDQKTWIGIGHTIPNGNPPSPFWGSSVLDTMLLLPPIVVRDTTLPQELSLGGDAVHFLWVVPLTSAECRLKLAKGLDAILDLFQQNRHPHVFDPYRKSYV